MCHVEQLLTPAFKKPSKMSLNCCNCGNPLEDSRAGKQRYCKACHAAYMRANRPKYIDLSSGQKFKANTRSYSRVYQKRGKLLPQLCAKCGDPKAEKHHEDYSKPLEVIWLCRKCHLELHNS